MTWITIDTKPYDEKLNGIEKAAKAKGYAMVTLHLLELKDGGLLVEYDVYEKDKTSTYLVPASALVDRDAAMKFIQE